MKIISCVVERLEWPEEGPGVTLINYNLNLVNTSTEPPSPPSLHINICANKSHVRQINVSGDRRLVNCNNPDHKYNGAAIISILNVLTCPGHNVKCRHGN